MTAVWKQVWVYVNEQMSDQVAEHAEYPPQHQVWVCVRNQPWERIHIQVQDPLWDQLTEEIRDA